MLTALSSALLTACAAGQAPRALAPAPDPVIETRTVEHQVCPAELMQDAGPRPAPASDAVIRHNLSGGEYLDALIADGLRLAALFNDAKAQCPSPEKTAQ